MSEDNKIKGVTVGSPGPKPGLVYIKGMEWVDPPGSVTEATAKAVQEAVKAERERIINLIQTLLSESEMISVEKPEFYGDIYIYRGLIELINKGNG